MRLFKKGQKRVRHLIQNAITQIHITCDAWTSPNHLSMLAVVGHFVDENLKQQTILLALKEIQELHSGENMTPIVLEALETYEYRDKLSYLVADNHQANDTMLRAIAASLRENGIEYDSAEHRLRCIDHIINLSVQAYLFGKHPELEHKDIIESERTKMLDEELQKFRKLETQERLHNVNTFIMTNPQRVQRFKELSKSLMPM